MYLFVTGKGKLKGWNRGDKVTRCVGHIPYKAGVNTLLQAQFTTLLAQLLLAKASGLALKAKPIPSI